MKIGMLWECGTKNKKEKYNLKKEILKAAEYYETKYGYQADTCFLNSNVTNIEDIEYNGYKIKVLKDKCISPLQLWIGTEEEKVK